MGNPALNKYGMFGWIAQDSKRATPAASGWNWVPFIDEPTFKWTPNATTLDQADRIHHDHTIYSNAEFYTGGISFYLMPGTVANLIAWIQTRDAWNQGKWASVVIENYDTASRHKVFASDVKVASAEFIIEQNSPVRCNLDLIGITNGLGTAEAVTAWDTALGTPATAVHMHSPYINKETTFKFDASGSDEVQTYDIRNCTIRVDNKVQSPEEGMRFNGSNSPYQLYNEGGVRVTGSFARDYVDSDCYTAFKAMYQEADWYLNSRYGAMEITLARTGSATMVVSMQHLAYTDHTPGMRGSRDGVLVESLDFTAMGARTAAGMDPTTPTAADFPILLSSST